MPSESVPWPTFFIINNLEEELCSNHIEICGGITFSRKTNNCKMTLINWSSILNSGWCYSIFGNVIACTRHGEICPSLDSENQLFVLFAFSAARWLRQLSMRESQSIDPGFESVLLLFQSLGISVLSTTPQFNQVLNEHLAVDSVNMWMNGLRRVIATWLSLNASQKSRLCVEIHGQVCQGVKCKACWAAEQTALRYIKRDLFPF